MKEFVAGGYYHVYNRGVEKRRIFMDDQDYQVFLGLLKKYLAGENHNKANRHAFTPLQDKVSLLSYCLMPNHFHLLLYQQSATGVTELMRRVTTGYVMYFNNRYSRVGRLFQGTYKAAHVNADGYLHHISRYIHLNPDEYKTWPYSSLPYYRGEKEAAWIRPEMVLELELFGGDRQRYLQFVEDYVVTRNDLSVLKHQLASSSDEWL